MTSSGLLFIVYSMDEIKINIQTNDILKNPHGKVLLIGKFKDEKEENALFNKIDQILGKRLSKRSEQIGFKGEENEQRPTEHLPFKRWHR